MIKSVTNANDARGASLKRSEEEKAMMVEKEE